MKIDSHLPNTLILTSPVSWFNPSQQLCTATLSLSPPVGQEKESEEQKWENSWIDIKAVLQIKWKLPNLPLPLGRQVFSTPGTPGLHHLEQWLGKTNALKQNPPFLLLPSVYVLTFHESGASLWSLGVSFPWLHPLPSSLSRPGGVGWGAEKLLTLCDPCLINTVCSTNPKHSPYCFYRFIYHWLWCFLPSHFHSCHACFSLGVFLVRRAAVSA